MKIEKAKSWKIGGFDSWTSNSKTERPPSRIKEKSKPKQKQYLNEDMEIVDSDTEVSKAITNTVTAPTVEQS